METGVHHNPSRLYDFIREHRDRILEEWARRCRAMPVASALSQPRLVDHMPLLLDRIASFTAGDGGRAALSDLPKLHALDRLDRGFDLKEVAAEYALLRASVLELYAAADEDESIADVARFDRAIDDAVYEAVEHYTRQRMRILTAVDRLTTSSPAGLKLPELLDRLLRVFIESSEAVDTCTILLLEKDGRLRARASIGLGEEVERRWSVAVGEGFAGSIAATMAPRMVRHASEDAVVMSPYIRAAAVRALYGVPLTVDTRLLGVAHMGSRTAFDFSEDDKALFRVLATRASVFIHENLMRSEAELRAAEREATIDAIPGAVIIANAAGEIVHANEAAMALAGASSLAELRAIGRDIPRRLMVRTAEGGRALAVPEMPHLRAAGGEVVAEDLCIHHVSDQRDIFVRCVAAPVRVRRRTTGVVCVLLDITDHRHLELERQDLLQKLADEHRRLQEIVQQVPAGVVIADAHSGRVTLVNDAARAIWRDDAAGHSPTDYPPVRLLDCEGRDLPTERYPLSRALAGETVHEEVQLRRRDGSIATCLSSAAPVHGRAGEIVSAVVTFVDITERKTGEQQLRALADNIPQLAWIADGDGAMYWFNQRWFEFTGTTLDEMKGWGWQSVHHPEHVQRVMTKLRRHLASGTAWEDTFPLRAANGRYRWFLARATPIRDERGKVVQWFGSSTDVTEQRRLEEAREQFLGILGHDLRNPLNAISMSVGLLESARLEAVLLKSVARIKSGAERMQRMIAELLDFTRGRLGGGIPIHPVAADLRGIVRAVLDETEAAHPGRKVTSSIAGDTAGTWDPDRLGQVVQNLVTNAIEHGVPDEAIVVRVDGTDADTVSLVVANGGPGIPPELMPHLFEPFRRSSGASAIAGRAGLGLGLFIVHEIARAHRGTIDVRSGEGQTRFEIRLPRHVRAD